MAHRLGFAGKKLLRMVLLLLGVSLAAFLLMSASPLDPLQTNVGQAALGTMSQEQIAQLEDYWGVNDPPLERYLGWLTENEAVGILWELSQKAAGELTGWREFACSYLFGGLMWKMLCGDGYADSYLTSLADAATNLLAGGGERPGGQWRACPWPARRPIGFSRH